MSEVDNIQQKDLQKFVIEKLGTEQWIVVYQTTPHEQKENIVIYSALVPYIEVPDLLKDYSWDITLDFGKPNISQTYPDKKAHYSRFSEENGIEPLVIRQYYYGLHETELNISEEFRLFHNLFWESEKMIFQTISFDTGEIDDVVRFKDNAIEIKIKYIKQFCAFKQMHLSIYLDVRYNSNYELSEIGFVKDSAEKKGEDYHFLVYWNDLKTNSSNKSYSIFIGKKYIPPMLIEETGIWPYEGKKQFEEFIIGKDKNGIDRFFTCDPDLLSDFFGKNPGSPNYLTPIFFRKEVLQKYFNYPEKYDVSDGYLYCGSLWGLCLDNNHEEYILAYLGDLGHLAHTEQIYWKSFNIPPEGSISQVAFNRHFMAEFTDPTALDLIFKKEYNNANKAWEDKNDWVLFLPLKPDDRFHFASLHIPLNPSQKEFDSQILSLTKLLIDSLNEKEITASISVTDDDKGIDKLEKYFSGSDKKDYKDQIIFLRNLQSLRSTGVAHRKGKNYTKACKHFELDKKNTITVYQEILRKAIAFLDFLKVDNE